MTISDEQLIAYLDNELSTEERERIDAALAVDPALQARLKRQERVQAVLSGAFDPALKQAVPPRLVDVAMTTPVSLRTGWRERIAGLLEWRPAAPRSAVAAAAFGLVLAVGVMLYAGSLRMPEAVPFQAKGQLAQVLETQLASDEVRGGPRVGVSFRAQGGQICRTFDLGSTQENFAGIACRATDGWAVKTFVSAPVRSGGPYELASAGLPPAVRNAVAGMIDGAPFDAAEERRARDGGWR
jgi:hypothetical protein